jgi:hypothetical protein
MGGSRDHQIKQNNPDSQRQTLQIYSHMQNLDLKKWWHECKSRTIWGNPTGERRRVKGEGDGDEYDWVHSMYVLK